jgi:hypothetical protein
VFHAVGEDRHDVSAAMLFSGKDGGAVVQAGTWPNGETTMNQFARCGDCLFVVHFNDRQVVEIGGAEQRGHAVDHAGDSATEPAALLIESVDQVHRFRQDCARRAAVDGAAANQVDEGAAGADAALDRMNRSSGNLLQYLGGSTELVRRRVLRIRELARQKRTELFGQSLGLDHGPGDALSAPDEMDITAESANHQNPFVADSFG